MTQLNDPNLADIRLDMIRDALKHWNIDPRETDTFDNFQEHGFGGGYLMKELIELGIEVFVRGE